VLTFILPSRRLPLGFLQGSVTTFLSIEKIDVLLISQWRLKVGRMRPWALSVSHVIAAHRITTVILVPRVSETQFQGTSIECQKFAIPSGRQHHFGMISRGKALILIPCGNSGSTYGADDDH
jgi:hypothetical protein